ncbi:MAG: hypothetical protein MJZ34_06000 [Paludibacteraceae bacterium]|nr:hypothetical protein [Paludibacteraceae bacterium]
MINWLFQMCVNFLGRLGKTTGLTYAEISVVFNLWVQGGLLVISALIPFVLALVRYCNNTAYFTDVVLTVALLLIYSIIYCWVFVHYGTSTKYAFDLCVNDLLHLAKLWHTSYYMVNIIIFIIGWLAAFGVNVFITWNLLDKSMKVIFPL